MPLVQHDDLIEELSADTADDSLDIGVLPRTPWGDQHLFDALVPHQLPEDVTVDPIAIAQQIPRCLVPGERVHDLLGRPRGCRVLTWQCTIRRRSCTRITRTKSTLYVTVGTTKKSMETKSLTWLCRNAFHVGEGGLRRRTRYVSTVDLATSMPSFCNSPTIRGAPQVG